MNISVRWLWRIATQTNTFQYKSICGSEYTSYIMHAAYVGSVFRTADAFRTEAIYICGYTAIPPRKEIDKTALGATETVAWKYFKKTAEAVLELKENGYKVFAIEQVEKSISLEQLPVDSEQLIALVFGNEVTGVDQQTISLCDGSIEIPQFGMKHSLNISVAAGIVLWEIVRRSIHRKSI